MLVVVASCEHGVRWVSAESMGSTAQINSVAPSLAVSGVFLGGGGDLNEVLGEDSFGESFEGSFEESCEGSFEESCEGSCEESRMDSYDGIQFFEIKKLRHDMNRRVNNEVLDALKPFYVKVSKREATREFQKFIKERDAIFQVRQNQFMDAEERLALKLAQNAFKKFISTSSNHRAAEKRAANEYVRHIIVAEKFIQKKRAMYMKSVYAVGRNVYARRLNALLTEYSVMRKISTRRTG